MRVRASLDTYHSSDTHLTTTTTAESEMEAAPDALEGPSVGVRALKDITFGSVRHYHAWYSLPSLPYCLYSYVLCLPSDRSLA